MSGSWHDLRSYYEAEATLGLRGPLRGRRVELRERFIQQLAGEARGSVLDLGAGPGRDGQAFLAAGLDFTGVDLAHGNAVLASESGVSVLQASVTAVPLKSASREAGWSMSTLMHLTEAQATLAIAELARVLKPGAPAVVGIWGREAEATETGDGIPNQRRPFHLRSFDNNTALVAKTMEIEDCERWPNVSEGWDYHVFWVRTHLAR